MTGSQQDFVAGQYAPRAASYLTSAVHAAGADLDEIEAFVGELRPARVLDIGCGGGHVAYRAAAHAGQVVACDVTAAMLDVVASAAAERGLTNLSTRLGAAEHLPFEAGSFDVALSRFSAHHWADWEAGLREIRRVLTPSGRALIVDTVAPERAVFDTYLQSIELLRDRSHVRNQTVAAWVAALARSGFAVTAVVPRRLRLEFASWVARTATPDEHVAAIRSLQAGAPEGVRRYFEIEADGSFTFDQVSFFLAVA